MLLITKEIAKRLPKLYATEKTPVKRKVIQFKLFVPWGSGTWYITEGEQQEGDWLLYGYVTGLACNEWGYISLNELKQVSGPFGLKIERDRGYGRLTVEEANIL